MLNLCEHKTSQPSALVAIIDCDALWLQICHRHICLTRRAPYKGKPLCSLHRRTENFLRTRRARACPRRLHCRYQRRNGGSKRPPYDYLNHLYTQKRGRTLLDSFSFNLSKFQPHLCTSAAPIKRVPSPFRGRGTACGGRGQYIICEAHNSKQKRIRRSAAKIEGVTAHLLSLVFSVRS